jgi:hypothetical protein
VGFSLKKSGGIMIDFVSNDEISGTKRAKELINAYTVFEHKIHLVSIP